MRRTMVMITMLGCAAPRPAISEPPTCPEPVVAAAAPPPRESPVSPGSRAPRESRAPTTKQCPISLRGEVMPGVASFATATAANANMRAIAQGEPFRRPDLDALAKHHAGAFFSTVPRGYLHESVSGLEYVHAVFVQPRHYTVVARVLERVHAIPAPARCPAAVLEPGTSEIAIIAPHLGHFRITRWAEHDDELTSPVVPATTAAPAGCASVARLRVEDHFVDLETGEHLRAFVQTYETDPRAPGTPQLYAFEEFRPTEGGIELAGSSCSYFWDD